METITLNLPAAVALTDEQFYQLCIANEEWRLEQTPEGELIIMPPTGGESGIRNSDLNLRTSVCGIVRLDWEKSLTLPLSFNYPTVRSVLPDAAWVIRERWEALSAEDKRRFPPLCPDFVIELRSQTDSLETLRAKMRYYRTNGCRLGWLIDPQTPLVEIYRLSQDVAEVINFSFDQPPTLSGEDVLPGFVLDLTPILNP
jgi:Uma2 family endonuclease